MTEDSGTWVYAVTAGRSDPGHPAAPDLAGVGGEPVRVIAEAGLEAIVNTVDLGEYGEEPLRRNLENLEWLEATARAHHAVIDAIARTGQVVPTQLATVYRGDDRVAAMLAERRDDLLAALSRIRERAEWGVKIYLSGDAEATGSATAGAAPDGTAPAEAARAGAAYLQRRRSQLSAREHVQHAAAASAEEIHAELAGLAVAARVHKPQHPQLTGRSEPMILNSTYLVDDERAGLFSAAADELAGQYPGVRLELTGPWPPYSFTLPDEPDPEDGTAAAGGNVRA